MNRRLRDAGKIAAIVLDAMAATDVPIDTCIMASEITRESARALGYRARVLPCRVRVPKAPPGVVVRELGYSPTVEVDRYNGHAVALIDGRVVVDVTAAQIASGVPSPVIFEASRAVKVGHALTVEVRDFQIIYMPFDDGGDWTRGVDSAMARDGQRIGREIASIIRKGR